jgi:hypothetical protein
VEVERMTAPARASLCSRLTGALIALLVTLLLAAAFLVARAPLGDPLGTGTEITIGSPFLDTSSHLTGFATSSRYLCPGMAEIE